MTAVIRKARRNPILTACIDAVEASGGHIEVSTRTQHLRFYDANGQCLAGSSATPSDHRTARNLRSQLRQKGINVPR